MPSASEDYTCTWVSVGTPCSTLMASGQEHQPQPEDSNGDEGLRDLSRIRE